jgi:hypothetical protein
VGLPYWEYYAKYLSGMDTAADIISNLKSHYPNPWVIHFHPRAIICLKMNENEMIRCQCNEHPKCNNHGIGSGPENIVVRPHNSARLFSFRAIPDGSRIYLKREGTEFLVEYIVQAFPAFFPNGTPIMEKDPAESSNCLIL